MPDLTPSEAFAKKAPNILLAMTKASVVLQCLALPPARRELPALPPMAEEVAKLRLAATMEALLAPELAFQLEALVALPVRVTGASVQAQLARNPEQGTVQADLPPQHLRPIKLHQKHSS